MSESMDRIRFQKTHGIVGNSLEIRELVDTVMQVAPTDITVLLTGESGTGKEVIAHAIHNASRRATGKFIAVNCGAIPEGILESELFGHEKGSFTGAIEARKGYFEIADGGTIFLDEIGDTPTATQVKLLRVLESREFLRVGSSESRHTDVRIITATNKELEAEVQARRFRQDLYFRLRSVNIRIPPLRARRSDIPLLLEVFLAETIRKHGENPILFTDDAKEALQRYSWPGNIRELKNIVESVAVLEHGKVIDAPLIEKYLRTAPEAEDHRGLPVWLGKSSEQAERELIFRALLEIRTELADMKSMLGNVVARQPLALPAPASRIHPEGDASQVFSPDDLSLEEMEKKLISYALRRFDGNRRLAAKALKISERTLYRKIQDFGLS
jgi:DNA-binding NtrC family response regulator